jgi:GTP-binding protein
MLKICEPKFELSAVRPEQFPQSLLSEIAFVGRSNVGKSSIINALLGRKKIARVGGKPGMTRMINFFNVDNKFYFVDLPGYGYASVSREKKINWSQIIEKYLNERQQLKLLVFLVDIRHIPSVDDRAMLKWIKNYNIPHIIVATKYDKISRIQLKPKINDIKVALEIGLEDKVVSFSSISKVGKEELLNILEVYLSDDIT